MKKKEKLNLTASKYSILPRIYRDKIIRNIDIARGLNKDLYDSGFSIESILNTKSSDIAQILGVDDYIGKIIYKETKKLQVNN